MDIKSVKTTILEFLRNQIVTGAISPGQKLNETQLSSDLGVSRPPLREAFRTLEHEQLLVYVPRKGTYVKEISIKALEEVFVARKMIEGYAIDLFEANNLKNLPRVNDALKGLGDFHVELVESTGNPWLIHFYKSISPHIARYRYINASFPEREARALNDHEQIRDFIGKGLFDKAKRCLVDHIVSSATLLKGDISF